MYNADGGMENGNPRFSRLGGASKKLLGAEEFVASMLSKYHAYRWLEMNGFERCLIEGDI
jgi:hypothetical protein